MLNKGLRDFLIECNGKMILGNMSANLKRRKWFLYVEILMFVMKRLI